MKQMGAKPVNDLDYQNAVLVRLKDKKGGDPLEWPEELRVRQMPDRMSQNEPELGF